MTLIQDVTNDRAAEPSTGEASSVNEIFTHFVDHYRQPIHQPCAENFDYYNDLREDEPVSPMLEHFRLRLADVSLDELLQAYTTHVRSTFCYQKYDGDDKYCVDVNGIAILWHYERLLQQIVPTPNAVDRDTTSYTELLHVLGSDITRCSGISWEEKKTAPSEEPLLEDPPPARVMPDAVSRYVLPSLLRIQLYVIQSISLVDENLQCRLVLQCLALDTDSLDLPPSLFQDLTDVGHHWTHRIPLEDDMPPMTWNLAVMEGIRELEAPYLDSALVHPLVRQLYAAVWPDVEISNAARLVQYVLSSSNNQIARILRAHFAGRDEPLSLQIVPAEPRTRTRLHLGQTITETVPPEQNSMAPHLRCPSRLVVAVHFLLSLEKAAFDGDSLGVLLDHILPILYQLLDADDKLSMEWGAICTYHVLKITSKTETWRENLRPMVRRKSQLTREPLAMGVLALMQFHLDAVDTDILISQLRLLSQSCRPPYDRARALLLGGVLPSLGRRTLVERMDVTRATLVAILPMLQDTVATPPDVVNAACVALSFVLEAPILAQHHGGKLMATMLRVLLSSSDTKRLHLIVAGMVRLAGADRAGEVLETLAKDGNDRARAVCAQVQVTAEEVRAAYTS